MRPKGVVVGDKADRAAVMARVMNKTEPMNHRVSPSRRNLPNLPCRQSTSSEKFRLAAIMKADVTYSMKGEFQWARLACLVE